MPNHPMFTNTKEKQHQQYKLQFHLHNGRRRKQGKHRTIHPEPHERNFREMKREREKQTYPKFRGREGRRGGVE